MLNNDESDDQKPRVKTRRKSKGAAQAPEEPIGDDFDAMLDNASKAASRAMSSRRKSGLRPAVPEPAGGWSNEGGYNDEAEDVPNAAPAMRRATRRTVDETVTADIPTIPMDDADGDDAIDMSPEVAVAPEFSVHQIATFKEIEKEFSRTRASQFIDPKIDIGILYHNLNLQEELDSEDQKVWDWDKLFVEVRNAITNPITE